MKIKKIYASEVAVLDSNVYNGGGADDTEALQAVLDLSKDEETGVHLVMDGAARVRQLNLYSNTTIECMNKDCGFYQTDFVNCCLIRNAVWNRQEIKTRNISILGGTYHQNGQHQEHDDPTLTEVLLKDNNNEYDEYYVRCLEFYGVENLFIRDVTIRDFRTYAVMVGCFKCVNIENVWLDLPYGTKGNQDGFHFWGPGQFLNILHCGGKVGDDVINVGPDEGDKVSSITDVLIDGIFMDDGEQAVRLLSRGTGTLDRVTVRNVSGVYRSYGFYIDPWFDDYSMGNMKNIFIENVDLKAVKNTYTYHPPVLFSVGGNVECITFKNIRHHNSYDNRTLFEFGLPFYTTHPDNYDDMELPCEQKMETVIIEGLTITENEDEPHDTNYICVYDMIDNFILKNVTVIKNQKENGTLIHFGKKGRIKNFVRDGIYTKGLKTLIDDETKLSEC